MDPTGINRRKFRRAIFSAEDNIQAVFSFPGKHERPIHTSVLNLSEGGMQITVETQDLKKIKPGAKLVLLQIRGPFPFEYLVSIDSEVKWVVSHQILQHAGIGCEFQNISSSSREQIGSFVRDWYDREENA